MWESSSFSSSACACACASGGGEGGGLVVMMEREMVEKQRVGWMERVGNGEEEEEEGEEWVVEVEEAIVCTCDVFDG